MNTSAANSKKVIRMLGFDLHWWNGAMLWSSGLAVFAALAAIISTTVVIRLQNREFESYRNEMGKAVALARTVAEAARKESEDAHARSIEADERTAAISHQAEVERLRQNKKVAQLEADLAKADQHAVEVQQQAEAEREQLNAQLRATHAEITSADQRGAEASDKAEAERLQRLKLEANLGPRRLGPALINHLSRKLTGLAGMKVDLIVYESLSLDAPAPFQAVQLKKLVLQSLSVYRKLVRENAEMSM